MKTSEKLRTRNFVWLAIALLGLLGLMAVSFLKQSRSTKAVTSTWEVKKAIADVINDIKDAETGERGYLITSETDYLAPYHSALTNYELNLKALKDLTAQDSVQQKSIVTLDSLTQLKFKELDILIDLSEEGKDSLVVAQIKTDRGKEYMDNIRLVRHQMLEHEENLLAERIQNFKNWRTTSIILAIIAAMLVVYSLIKIYRDVYPVFNKIIETRKELHNTSANLAETVEKLKQNEESQAEELEAKAIKLQAQKVKIDLLEKEIERIKSKKS